MLEKPDIPDSFIVECLQDEYQLAVAQLEFLPLGADPNTAVYRAIDASRTVYFVKLRRNSGFDPLTVRIPQILSELGVQQIIAPLMTQSNRLEVDMDVEPYIMTVYPFIKGRDGYEAPLADHHWIELGQALKGIHTADLPINFELSIRRENFSDKWRESVRKFQRMIDDTSFDDPVAAELVAFLKSKRIEISILVGRAEHLASVVKWHSLPFVLCHADIHAWNVLIDEEDKFYIVDWDTPILAPKERDLMFIGAGIGGVWNNAREESLFYEGYGHHPSTINQDALAYYRFERIVEDIAVYCEEILMTTSDVNNADRNAGLQALKSQFLPGNVVDIAMKSDSGTNRNRSKSTN